MAFMSGLWNSIVGGNDKEENWHIISQLFIDTTKKYFSVSEVDKEENVIVFSEAHNISFNKTGGFGINYTPLSCISCYHIDSRKAEVKMPSGHIDQPVIEDNHDGTVSIKYDPREEGVHELYVKYNGEHVQGSPYKFHVDSISSGYVTAYGSGLLSGVSGEPSQFTISTKGAGAGGLSMAVEGPSKAEITCHDNKDGTVAVSFLPTAPGEYKVSVRFGDKHIKGSPFLAKVTGEGRKRNQISVGSCSEVTLPGKVADSDIRSLNASIQAPSGLEEPCFLKKLPSGNIGISFTPREVGQHIVSVKKMGSCPSATSQLNPDITSSTSRITSFDLAATVTSPGGVSEDAEIQEVEDGLYSVHFVPKELGVHTVSVKYREIHIPGTSRGGVSEDAEIQEVEDGLFSFHFVPKELGVHTVSVKYREIHIPGEFIAPAGGVSPRTPRSRRWRMDCTPSTSCPRSWECTLSPSSTGRYIYLHQPGGCLRGRRDPGGGGWTVLLPLRAQGAGSAHCLRQAGGPGLERGEAGRFNEFNVWTREAGAGQLAISLEGPSKGDIDFKDRKDGSCDVPFKVYISPAVGDAHLLEVAQFPDSAQNIDGDQYSIRFMPRENGVHNINVRFNGIHIPASPLRIKVGKDDSDPAAVHVHGPGLAAVKTGVKTDLIIDTCNAGVGILAVTMDGPSRVAMDCTEVEEGYKVRYTPLAPGFYYLSVKYNGHHIKLAKGAQKQGPVLPNFKSDATKVTSKGMGLKKAFLNKHNQFTVHAGDAGKNNYECWYVVRDRGDYIVIVKWGDEHIPGSPYKVEV
ncbi:Filamin [Operophtera brumata]|uniref:Filamin n=1 Tax=Operophtera brumata TaxID=104452 RepID=A0A0L7LS48_OPEBR|nr:Filamin [Operophtera brumata]